MAVLLQVFRPYIFLKINKENWKFAVTKANTKKNFVPYPGLALSDIIGRAFLITNDSKMTGSGNIDVSGL